MNEIKRVFEQIEAGRRRMIELQTRLCAVPAIAPESGGQGESAKAEALVRWLGNGPLSKIEVYEAPDHRVPSGKRPNVVVTVPGTEARRLWVISHMDVVPPGELSLWDTPPYEAVEKNGKLYGRGVEDNQQSLVASVFAAAAIRELGLTPRLTVKLLFMADEETGSEKGIRFLLATESLFRKDDLILVPDIGSENSDMIEIAEKSVLWLRFQTSGRQCHASTPEKGVNAFVAGSELVLRLNRLNEIFASRDPLFDPPVSTFAPTKKDPNIPNINTIPGEDVFYVDCRILPSVGIPAVQREIASAVREVEQEYSVSVSCEEVQKEVSEPTPEDAPIVLALKRSVPVVYPCEPRAVGIGGGTVGAHIRNAGFPAACWSTVDETAHMPNEYCRIDHMVADAKVMAHLMLAGPEQGD